MKIRTIEMVFLFGEIANRTTKGASQQKPIGAQKLVIKTLFLRPERNTRPVNRHSKEISKKPFALLR